MTCRCHYYRASYSMQSIAPHFPLCLYFSHFPLPNLRRLINLVVQAFFSNRRHSYVPSLRQRCRRPTRNDNKLVGILTNKKRSKKRNMFNVLLWPTNSVVVQIAMHSHGYRSMNVHCPDSSKPLLHPPYRLALVQLSNGACDNLWPPEILATEYTYYPNCSTLVPPQLVRPVRWPTKEFVCNSNLIKKLAKKKISEKNSFDC